MDKLEQTIKDVELGLRIAKGTDCGLFKTSVKSAEQILELLKENEKTYNPWRFFKFRKATEEEVEYYREEYGFVDDEEEKELQMVECVPGDGEEVLLWTGYEFAVDTYDDGMFEGHGEIEEGMAWRYLPEQPKKGDCE